MLPVVSPNNSVSSLPKPETTNQRPHIPRHVQSASASIGATLLTPEEDEEFLSNSASSTWNNGQPPSANSGEIPLVSDTSESQLNAPAHDFGFYEWDFQDTDHQGDAPTTTVSATASEPPLSDGHVQFSTLAGIRHPAPSSCPNSVVRSSIEDLMRPSMYKSQLSRELGTALAAELHSEMFGGISTESFASRERTRSTGMTDFSIPTADDIRQLPPPPVRRGRNLRHHTIDIMSRPPERDMRFISSTDQSPPVSLPSDDLVLSSGQSLDADPVIPTRSKRRSRTADFHFDRGSIAITGGPARRQRSADADRVNSLRKLLSRLSTKKKR